MKIVKNLTLSSANKEVQHETMSTTPPQLPVRSVKRIRNYGAVLNLRDKASNILKVRPLKLVLSHFYLGFQISVKVKPYEKSMVL